MGMYGDVYLLISCILLTQITIGNQKLLKQAIHIDLSKQGYQLFLLKVSGPLCSPGFTRQRITYVMQINIVLNKGKGSRNEERVKYVPTGVVGGTKQSARKDYKKYGDIVDGLKKALHCILPERKFYDLDKTGQKQQMNK